MKRVCAWCKKAIDLGLVEVDAEHPVTHGICETCAAALLAAADDRADASKLLHRALKGLPQPLLAYSGRIEVVEATPQAGELFGATPESLAGARPGDVIHCANAQHAVCGTTPECPACALRNSMTAAVRDGISSPHVKADRTVILNGEPSDVQFEFSTERVGSLGLLVIHRVDRTGES